jgi:hypothetical protein
VRVPTSRASVEASSNHQTVSRRTAKPRRMRKRRNFQGFPRAPGERAAGAGAQRECGAARVRNDQLHIPGPRSPPDTRRITGGNAFPGLDPIRACGTGAAALCRDRLGGAACRERLEPRIPGSAAARPPEGLHRHGAVFRTPVRSSRRRRRGGRIRPGRSALPHPWAAAGGAVPAIGERGWRAGGSGGAEAPPERRAPRGASRVPVAADRPERYSARGAELGTMTTAAPDRRERHGIVTSRIRPGPLGRPGARGNPIRIRGLDPTGGDRGHAPAGRLHRRRSHDSHSPRL